MAASPKRKRKQKARNAARSSPPKVPSPERCRQSGKRKRKADKQNAVLRIPVTDFELSVRAQNCLNNASIGTLGELIVYSEAEMLKFRNFGRKSLNELNAILEGLGLSFGMEIGKFQDVVPKTETMALAEDDF